MYRLITIATVLFITGAVAPAGLHAQPSTAAAGAAHYVDDEQEHGFYFRATLGAGYGHYVYLDSDRNGGGPLVPVSFTIGHRIADGLVLAGTAAFEPIVAAKGITGATSGHFEWGPELSPGGYFGVTLLFPSDLVQFDITVGAGGGGSRYSGGFGLIVTPSLEIRLVSWGLIHLGAYLRPVLGFLVADRERAVLYAAGSGGLALTFY